MILTAHPESGETFPPIPFFVVVAYMQLSAKEITTEEYSFHWSVLVGVSDIPARVKTLRNQDEFSSRQI